MGNKAGWNINGEMFYEDTKIKFVENPKRENSKARKRYEMYEKARTFKEYMDLNVTKYALADFRNDHSKGFVQKLD